MYRSIPTEVLRYWLRLVRVNYAPHWAPVSKDILAELERR